MSPEQTDPQARLLIAAVAEFNRAFDEWMKQTGCVAQFGWKYTADKQIKALEVLGIDKIVYRKPPPDYRRMQEEMEKGAP